MKVIFVDQSTLTAALISSAFLTPETLSPSVDGFRLSKGVNINCNCTFLDTCPITIGSRILIRPNCSSHSATHPVDSCLRNGISGPKLGAPIMMGGNFWLGGNAFVYRGITIGRCAMIGAGRVITKNVLDFCVMAGNPARILKKIEPNKQNLALAKSDG